MKINIRISLILILFTGIIFTSFADRGFGKKKAKITFNIKAPSSFASSLSFNLKNGLRYTGSLLSNNVNANSKSYNSGAFLTYTKGNSVYIIPYKQKVFVADSRPGYSGTKLILRRK